MKSLTNQQLHSQLQQVTQGIDQTIDWISTVRRHAARLDIEADHLALKLRRVANKARHLAQTSRNAMTIGFFGHSSAGRKYLISALIADEHGRVATRLGGKTLDFWQQIKPDYQASGLVTRFSHHAVITDEAYPVRLSLLSEQDIARIMATAFLLDGHQEKAGHALDEQYITDHLQQLAMHRQPVAVAGINNDDVIALWDSLLRHDAVRQKALETHFWPAAVALAPYLSIDDRARLFALLWGESEELTAAYRHFAYTLQHLGHVQQVLAPLGVLVDDTLLPANGIMNVATLSDLNTPADVQIQVRPCTESNASESVTLSLAELTLLTVELTIPLQMPAQEKGFETVDLLDFPNFSEKSDLPPHAEDDCYPLANRLSRAKNTYLLERYTDKQQINLLLVCQAVSLRNEVKHIGKALDYWVKETQGENTQVRSRRNPGLIWVLTPFDQRIVAEKQPPIFVAKDKNYDEAVQRSVGNPGDSWGTMLAVDQRGVERMIAYLSKEIHRGIKAERISEQLQELQRELVDNLLLGWHQPTFNEAQHKQRIAEILLKTLQTRTGVHGELLERLLPSREELRHLYLFAGQRQQQVGSNEPRKPQINTEPFSIGIDIDLFSDSPVSIDPLTPPAPAASDDYEMEYATRVQRYWINHLRQLPDNGPLVELLGVTKPTIELLVSELITASIRLDVAGSLVNILADNEQVGQHREMKADRQVSRVLAVLGDFVAWLGFLHVSENQRPESRINRGYKIFAHPPQSASSLSASLRLTKLSLAPTNNTAFYIYDWLVGLGEMITQNEGHCAGNEISELHRQQLAAIVILLQPKAE
ncbi:putative virulence factor [Yersinia aldovae]|uniref:putative virulence factor n=1 Tax=Yersinia aldovae TaxID=29483 RepID=UPI0005ABECC4|nr:virulence factor SrfC family protein [Yersinia aldovae]AJJ62020.1 bacterial virulence factor family protein [Yersinia aldovae 670-83]